jgi:hypothetical protein
MGFPGNDVVRPLLAAVNPLHLRYMEVTTNGYAILEAGADRMSVSYITPVSITEPDQPSVVLARFEVDRGTARIRMVEGDGFMPRPDEAAPPDPGTDAPPAEPPAAPADPIPAEASFTG